MHTTTLTAELPAELDHRSGDGLDVWLLWTPDTNRLFVLVVDTRLDSTFELDVDAADAVDAFRHPYAYAATRGIPYRAVAGGRTRTLV